MNIMKNKKIKISDLDSHEKLTVFEQLLKEPAIRLLPLGFRHFLYSRIVFKLNYFNSGSSFTFNNNSIDLAVPGVLFINCFSSSFIII